MKVRTIGIYAFWGNNLTGTLTIPDYITSVGNYAFQWNDLLTDVECYVTRDIINSTGCFLGTNITTLRARVNDNSWSNGADTIGGKSLTVVKDLT